MNTSLVRQGTFDVNDLDNLVQLPVGRSSFFSRHTSSSLLSSGYNIIKSNRTSCIARRFSQVSTPRRRCTLFSALRPLFCCPPATLFMSLCAVRSLLHSIQMDASDIWCITFHTCRRFQTEDIFPRSRKSACQSRARQPP